MATDEQRLEKLVALLDGEEPQVRGNADSISTHQTTEAGVSSRQMPDLSEPQVVHDMPATEWAASAGVSSGSTVPGAEPDFGGMNFPQAMPPAEAGLPMALPVTAGGGEEDSGMLGLLKRINDGIEGLGRSQDQEPRERRQLDGPSMRPWPAVGSADFAEGEGFATASPSVDVSNRASARGAGGYGFGSARSSTHSNYLEPYERRARG